MHTFYAPTQVLTGQWCWCWCGNTVGDRGGGGYRWAHSHSIVVHVENYCHMAYGSPIMHCSLVHTLLYY